MFANNIIAQSTERFIRIIGNSSYEFKADTYRVYFNISEILPNNYNKEEYKSLESNITETMDFLKKNGIKENQIFKNYKSKNSANYNNVKSEFYYMDITNKETLSKIIEADIETYDKYVTGQVYRYTIYEIETCSLGHTHKNVVECCGSFFDEELAEKEGQEVLRSLEVAVV
jgi:hypothetical protein